MKMEYAMKVVIFTEDTAVKLPPINQWTGKYGRDSKGCGVVVTMSM